MAIRKEKEMKCPLCKTKNPIVLGWYSCMGGTVYKFNCCGERATFTDSMKSITNMMRQINKEFEKNRRGRLRYEKKQETRTP